VSVAFMQLGVARAFIRQSPTLGSWMGALCLSVCLYVCRY